MRSQFNIITSILLVFITFWASAQKVGVVLSGGGPKGVTHVGVLKALEDNNIPIDFITGTSMGAIIGGMYASGYSPEEIEQMIQSEEMVSWLSTVMDPQYSYFFKQSPPNASWQLFKITYERELQTKLPSTIISPYKLDLGFLQLYSGASAAAGYDFDSLYIPFRCVASDIEANKQVVIDKGRLEKAIRASMSFPFYFKPVEINGRLMFDGGMYNNFPADVMTDSFNPDIIIGSKAASNYGPPDEDDIISQIQSMLMANTQYEISPDSGILIVPQLWSVNVTDFSNTPSFIDSGYISTIRQIDRIKEFVKRTESKDQKTIKRNRFKESIPPLQIKDVIIEGVTETRKVYLSRLIKKDKFLLEEEEGKISPGETYEEIKRHYYAILSDEKVESVYPELTYDHADTGYNLQFNVTPNQRLEAEIGGLISSQAINEIFLQFEYNIWGRTALSLTGNAYFGRFHNSGLFRAHYDIPSRLPLSFSLGYTLNGWNYFRTKTYFFADENPSFLIQRESFWDFDIATPVTRTSRIMAQLQWGLIRDEYYQDNQFTRVDTADLTYFDFYSPGLIYELNTLNRKQFPSEGALLKICGRFISGLEENEPGSTSVDTTHISIYHNWLQVRLIFDNYFNLSKKFDMGLYGQIALSDKQEFNNYVSTVLAAPAFEPLPESQTIFLPQFRAHSFFSIGIKTIFHPIRNLDFRAEAYLFQPYREILKTEDNKTAFGDPLAKQYYIFSSRFVYYAPFGPISVSLNYYESLEEPFVFNLHIGYYIFNKKPFR